MCKATRETGFRIFRKIAFQKIEPHYFDIKYSYFLSNLVIFQDLTVVILWYEWKNKCEAVSYDNLDILGINSKNLIDLAMCSVQSDSIELKHHECYW